MNLCVAVWLSSSNDLKVTADLTQKPSLAVAFETCIQEMSGLNLRRTLVILTEEFLSSPQPLQANTEIEVRLLWLLFSINLGLC